MNVLIACEESQRVCSEMRQLGHDAYSCDVLDCSGGHPEWHIRTDVLPLLDGFCAFETQDGITHALRSEWDLIIAHPPCTYLTGVATRHHSLHCTPLEKINQRTIERIEAMRFFMHFALADCEHIAIENPVGVMNTTYRKPDQIIHPYYFAEGEGDTENYVTKATCLWLKGLEPLTHKELPKPDNRTLFGVTPSGKARTWEDTYSHDPSVRSKTFPGIAKAMAEQWAGQA